MRSTRTRTAPQGQGDPLSEQPAPLAGIRWPALWAVALIVAFVAVAGTVGYRVDRERTESFREILRDADALATKGASADPLDYVTIHNHLAAAAGVDSCSAFALRMTQRFFPEGMRFHPEDVTAVRQGQEPSAVRIQSRQPGRATWECRPTPDDQGSESTF